MPYSMYLAQTPVTKGVAIEVPVRMEYPPPGAQERMFSPGATKSGLIWLVSLVYPLPEKEL